MKNKNKINKILNDTKGKLLSVTIDSRRIVRGYGKPLKISARILEETDHYVTLKPASGLFRGASKFNKNSIKNLKSGKLTYNRK